MQRYKLIGQVKKVLIQAKFGGGVVSTNVF